MNKILLIITLLFLSSSAFSAVKTWDGETNGQWSVATNWSENTLPASGDELVFPAAAVNFAINNDLQITKPFNSIRFEGGNYSLGGNPLRLAGGLTVLRGSQTVTAAVTLEEAQTINLARGSYLRFGLFSNGTSALTIEGGGLMWISAIAGTGEIVQNGNGVTLLAASSGFAGAITVNQGVFVVDANLPNSTINFNSPVTGSVYGLGGLGGTGRVGAVNFNQGLISAGTLNTPTGILNTGSLTLTADGNYVCKLRGTTPGAAGHDQLNVTGTVSLANARLVTLPWNYRAAINDSFLILQNDGQEPIDGTFLNLPEGAVFVGLLNTAFRITYQGGDGNDVVITKVNRAPFDFDGDGRSDVSSFRPSEGTWNAVLSGSGAPFSAKWGLASDKLAPADFDGDNKTDLAVFRDGVWWIFNSATNSVSTVSFGLSGDVPVPQDYDGDGRADIAVFRPSDGTWYQLRSFGNQFVAQKFGAGGDQPLLGDFDGDGIADPAVFRPADGTWHLLRSANRSYTTFQFGLGSDKPCAADYDGDGKTDPCVFRGTAGENEPDFYILRSSDATTAFISWGSPGDLPTPGDFDGDGRSDVGVFRSASQEWFWIRSSNGKFGFSNFGENGDLPVASAYVP